MKKPVELIDWDFPDVKYVDTHSAFGIEEVPKGSSKNFRVLLKNFNNLVEVVNAIAEKVELEFDKE